MLTEQIGGSEAAKMGEGSDAGVLLCEACGPTCAEFGEAALRGEGVSVAYGPKVIIPPLDVAFPKEKITAIIGPNGCGKSTLLKALARTQPMRAGKAFLFGQPMGPMKDTEVARQMAFLPQSPQAPGGLTVEELVAYGRYPHQKGFGRLTDQDKQTVAWALEATHMEQFSKRPISALSGGQRQRAWIALALAQDTPLILLDEPTTYLDMAHQLEILELLQALNRQQGKTIVLVIHELNLAARCAHWMVAMKEGTVRAAGTPEAIMNAEMMREVFNLESLIAPDPWTGRPELLSYRLQ